MTIAFPDEFTAAASGDIELPGPEMVVGLPHVPAAEALVTARISGVGLLDNQMASPVPFGATAKRTWPTLVSLPDSTTGDDQLLLLMEPLTASACDVG
jgi:hypothetical protein